MSRRKKSRRHKPSPSFKLQAAQAFNKLLQRTRPKGEKIPVDYEEIEPDRGEKI